MISFTWNISLKYFPGNKMDALQKKYFVIEWVCAISSVGIRSELESSSLNNFCLCALF